MILVLSFASKINHQIVLFVTGKILYYSTNYCRSYLNWSEAWNIHNGTRARGEKIYCRFDIILYLHIVLIEY